MRYCHAFLHSRFDAVTAVATAAQQRRLVFLAAKRETFWERCGSKVGEMFKNHTIMELTQNTDKAVPLNNGEGCNNFFEIL